MKSLYLLIAYLICFSVSCNLTEKKAGTPFNPSLPYKPAKISENTNHPGYGVYMKTCYQCHDQTDPSTLSTEKWAMTVPAMAKHAGISEADGKHALDYILYVKSKGVR